MAPTVLTTEICYLKSGTKEHGKIVQKHNLSITYDND